MSWWKKVICKQSSIDRGIVESLTLSGIARRDSIQPHVLCDLALGQRSWIWWIITALLLM
jgi:hypothetical protein